MISRKEIKIEGYTPEEILNLSDEGIESFVFCGEPLAFKIGSAEILGEFRLETNKLIVELAHIDGGGEGVLPTLWLLAERYAEKRGLTQIEWLVHAVNCAKPNLKLRRILELKGFEIKNLKPFGEAFYLLHQL